ncbi:MAG TPA: selenocysteine-specific translation elongation factor [Gaiellaceae bacterium]|nr:selenocysteine-specific translation elongation factor [Gaiellaceae bacterium]
MTVGTAGHIDHGKTWLVRALTGKDTDRLPEEQRRGISIELGYAPLDVGDGRVVSVVDVPGHERFVRTMVAGASGIDLFLLVVDAVEGPRAQTHEHVAILRLLGVERGVVAVTKSDAVDAERLAAAMEEARELVPGAPVVAVSAKTGAGLAELRALIAAHSAGAARDNDAPARLFVDRVFTLHGVGTIATGTLWSGSISSGDRLRLEPGGRNVRVRSVQVHDSAVERAVAGRRVALNLDVERGEVRRGDAVVSPDAFAVSYRLDVQLDELAGLPPVVTVHHGTSDVPARVARIGANAAQLRLARPVVAAKGDRIILRAGTTVGGGVVVDPAPPRHADESTGGRPTVHEPVRAHTLTMRGLDLDGFVRSDGWVFAPSWLDELGAALRARIAAADPLDPGVPQPAAPWADAVVPLLGLERRGAKLYAPGSSATLAGREADVAMLEDGLRAAGYEPIDVEDAALARHLESEGTLVRVGNGQAVARGAYERALALLIDECAAAGSITLARFRDLLGISRRPAQALLERFDADGYTRRVGDVRVLRRRATTRPSA